MDHAVLVKVRQSSCNVLGDEQAPVAYLTVVLNRGGITHGLLAWHAQLPGRASVSCQHVVQRKTAGQRSDRGSRRANQPHEVSVGGTSAEWVRAHGATGSWQVAGKCTPLVPAQVVLHAGLVQGVPQVDGQQLHHHVQLVLPQPGPQHQHHAGMAAVVQDAHLHMSAINTFNLTLRRQPGSVMQVMPRVASLVGAGKQVPGSSGAALLQGSPQSGKLAAGHSSGSETAAF